MLLHKPCTKKDRRHRSEERESSTSGGIARPQVVRSKQESRRKNAGFKIGGGTYSVDAQVAASCGIPHHDILSSGTIASQGVHQFPRSVTCARYHRAPKAAPNRANVRRCEPGVGCRPGYGVAAWPMLASRRNVYEQRTARYRRCVHYRRFKSAKRQFQLAAVFTGDHEECLDWLSQRMLTIMMLHHITRLSARGS